ncbi:MAG: phosphorylase [Methylococcales bacterium]
MSRIGIIAALPEEVKMLTRKTLQYGECLISEQFIICAAGIGAKNATKACELLHSKGAVALFSWGCAGALDPKLSAGDLILPIRVTDSKGSVIETSDSWGHKLQTAFSTIKPFNRGLLIQSPTMITSVSEKQSLFNTTAAVAVDMESYSIGSYAQQHGLPFIACRAIADSAQTELPEQVVNAMDAQGKIDHRKVLPGTLLRPWTIGPMLRLGIHFRKAQSTLATIAEQLIQIDHQPIS